MSYETPTTITLTGADDTTNIDDLMAMARKHPWAEWGILISKTSSGGHRFPSLSWVHELLVKTNGGSDMRLAFHVCGQWVRDIVERGRWGEMLYSTGILLGKSGFRFQLNFHGRSHIPSAAGFRSALAVSNFHQIILQMDGENDEILEYMGRAGVDVVPLFDQSSGAGITPDFWPEPIAPYNGYAGGLGEDNLAQEIARIASRQDRPWWVDMETKLYTPDGKFSLDRCEACIEIAGRSKGGAE